MGTDGTGELSCPYLPFCLVNTIFNDLPLTAEHRKLILHLKSKTSRKFLIAALSSQNDKPYAGNFQAAN